MEAREYCRKDRTATNGHAFIEIGDFDDTSQGKRTDVEDVRLAIVNGTPMMQIADNHFGTWMRNYRALDLYQKMKRKPQQDREVLVTLLIGPPGTGKSHWCRAQGELGSQYFYSKASTGIYFDDYKGEKTLVIDDMQGIFSTSHLYILSNHVFVLQSHDLLGHLISLSILLRVLDKYPYQLPARGICHWAKYTEVYMTSNVLPRDWYSYGKGMSPLNAVTRRIHRYMVFTGNLGEFKFTDEYIECESLFRRYCE